MAWFKRESGELDTSGEKKVRTEGLWVKCESCRQIIWKKDLEENMNVCPKCDKHFRIDARTRLAQLLDENQYEVVDADISSTDPLKFVDLKPYSSRLKQAQKDTGLKDAVINAHGKLAGRPVVASVMEYSFIGGSMGAVVGEAITRAVERAADTHTPLIIVSASGGARMMEGVISLMQLAKISAALAKLDHILCHAGRLEYRRTGSAHRIRGAAGDRADDPAKASPRLSAQRIPAATRHARCRGSPQAAQTLYRAGTGFHGGVGSCQLSAPDYSPIFQIPQSRS
jgi:hypothetical protein